MRSHHALVFAALVVAMPRSALADVELWTEAGVKRDLTRRVAVTFDQQLRFDADVS